MRIGLDSDGVMYNFAAAVLRYLVKHHGWDPNGHCPVLHWHFYRDWGLTDKQFVALCDEAANSGFLFVDGDLEDGVADGLARLRAAGHTLHLNTARNFGDTGVSEKNTRVFYEDRHQIKFDSYTFTTDKTVVKMDVMIEDNADNFHACEADGVTSFLRDQSWNRDVETPNRVFSFGEFVDRVLALEAAGFSSAA